MTMLVKTGVAAMLLLLPVYVYFRQSQRVEEFDYNTKIQVLEKEIEMKEAVLSALDAESKAYLQKAKAGEMDKDNAEMMIEMNEDRKKNLIIHVRQAKESLDKLKKEKGPAAPQ